MSIILRLQIPNYLILFLIVSQFSSLGYLNHQHPAHILKTQGKNIVFQVCGGENGNDPG